LKKKSNKWDYLKTIWTVISWLSGFLDCLWIERKHNVIMRVWKKSFKKSFQERPSIFVRRWKPTIYSTNKSIKVA
jgi:hypothetical protein